MTGSEFFSLPEVALPLARETDDFEGFVQNTFSKYLSIVTTLEPSDKVTAAIKADYKEIEQLCSSIKAAIEACYKGLPHLAFNNLNQGINKVWPSFNRLIIDENGIRHPQLDQLFRIRVAGPDEGRAFDKKDLFHIPFEKRHRVRRQRYSLPGVPCLYLGGTLYICWEEMDRPTFDSLYMSRFRLVKGETLRILDFSAMPAFVARMTKEQPSVVDYWAAHGTCWPLMAASSIKRKHLNEPFISEYIIPQLLLQWACTQNIDGIAYFSVKRNIVSDPPLATTNLVFPAAEMKATGYCERLQRKFEMSEPVSWQLIERNPRYLLAPDDSINSLMTIELVRGSPIIYKDSTFGRIEDQMLKLSAGTMKS